MTWTSCLGKSQSRMPADAAEADVATAMMTTNQCENCDRISRPTNVRWSGLTPSRWCDCREGRGGACGPASAARQRAALQKGFGRNRPTSPPPDFHDFEKGVNAFTP